MVAEVARRDEQAERDRQFLLMNEIGHDLRNAERAGRIDRALTILKNEQAGGLGSRVLGRNKNPVTPDGAGKDFTAPLERAFEFSLRHSGLRKRISGERVLTGLARQGGWRLGETWDDAGEQSKKTEDKFHFESRKLGGGNRSAGNQWNEAIHACRFNHEVNSADIAR